MPHNRYFIDQSPFVLHESIEIKGDEHRHLSKVMRMQKGEMIELVNGQGDLGIATIFSIHKEATVAQIDTLYSDHTQSGVTLCQALPKFSNLQWIVEKCTEVGVESILLFPSELSEKYLLSPSQQERLHHIIIAALKQCGRLNLPKISYVKALPTMHGDIFFGDLTSKTSLSSCTKPAFFLNGPEKGFSDKEIAQMREKSYKGVLLSPNILRTETAAIVAVAKLI